MPTTTPPKVIDLYFPGHLYVPRSQRLTDDDASAYCAMFKRAIEKVLATHPDMEPLPGYPLDVSMTTIEGTPWGNDAYTPPTLQERFNSDAVFKHKHYSMLTRALDLGATAMATRLNVPVEKVPPPHTIKVKVTLRQKQEDPVIAEGRAVCATLTPLVKALIHPSASVNHAPNGFILDWGDTTPVRRGARFFGTVGNKEVQAEAKDLLVAYLHHEATEQLTKRKDALDLLVTGMQAAADLLHAHPARDIRPTLVNLNLVGAPIPSPVPEEEEPEVACDDECKEMEQDFVDDDFFNGWKLGNLGVLLFDHFDTREELRAFVDKTLDIDFPLYGGELYSSYLKRVLNLVHSAGQLPRLMQAWMVLHVRAAEEQNTQVYKELVKRCPGFTIPAPPEPPAPVLARESAVVPAGTAKAITEAFTTLTEFRDFCCTRRFVPSDSWTAKDVREYVGYAVTDAARGGRLSKLCVEAYWHTDARTSSAALRMLCVQEKWLVEGPGGTLIPPPPAVTLDDLADPLAVHPIMN